MIAKRFIVLCIGAIFMGGCNSLRSVVPPEYQGRMVSVDRIGVGGPGASLAVQEFISKGYRTVELGATAEDAINKGREMGVPYVATVDAVDTSQAVWDGFYSFSMRVSDVSSGAIVWSSSATYGHGGILISAQGSSKEAYRDMVADFAKTFPPAGGLLPKSAAK